MAHPARSHPNHGFTLIELLTVIAVVAILATILTATLSGARSRAHLAKCTAALRSIHSITSLYLADNDQIYPHVPAKGYGTTYWRRSYLEYLGLSNESGDYLKSMSRTPFVCPDVGDFLAANNQSATFISYGMNYLLHETSAFNITNPSQTLLAMDAGANDNSLPPESITPALARRLGRNYHNGGANILFVDGHIDIFKDVSRLGAAPYNEGQEKDIWTP